MTQTVRPSRWTALGAGLALVLLVPGQSSAQRVFSLFGRSKPKPAASPPAPVAPAPVATAPVALPSEPEGPVLPALPDPDELLRPASATMPAPPPPAAAPRVSNAVKPRRVLTKNRSFKLPVSIDERDRPDIEEVRFYVRHAPDGPWVCVESAPPTRTEFPYHATEDGEYWFNFALLDRGGRLMPEDVAREAPRLIVTVDTEAPQIKVRKMPAVTGQVFLQCQLSDRHVDYSTLRAEYRTNKGQWVTLEPYRDSPGLFEMPEPSQFSGLVRVHAADKANNHTAVDVNLATGVTTPAEDHGVQPVGATESVSSPAPKPTPRPAVVPVTPPARTPEKLLLPPPEGPAVSGPAPVLAPVAPVDPKPEPEPTLPMPSEVQSTVDLPVAPVVAAPTPEPGNVGGFKPAQLPSVAAIFPQETARPTSLPTPTPASAQAPAPAKPVHMVASSPAPSFMPPSLPPAGLPPATMPPALAASELPPGTMPPADASVKQRDPATALIGSRRCAIDYAVDPPGSVGRVDVWMTRDGGQSWQFLVSDTDRVSPAEFELPVGDGVVGLILAVSRPGEVPTPPNPGDAPEWSVEVDTVAPLVRIVEAIRADASAGVLIRWTAADLNLETAPSTISVAPTASGPWQVIARGMPASGTHVWNPSALTWQAVHVRVEVIDAAGHVGVAESGPVWLAPASPRARVLGVSARPGMPR